MTYKDVMNYVNNTAKFGSNLGLERTEKLLSLLGNPHKKIKTIHIAGTNGKGSITAMTNKILMETGFKVGMYTSPYVEEFEERIQINNKNIPKQDLIYIIEKTSKAVDKVIELGYEHPTQFEIITCAMFLYFFEQKVDFAVIEVGLGGRLDSTNVIKPILSIIASISYDHMNILGNTLSEIAYEKAGIIKEHTPVILYPVEKEAKEVIANVAKNKKSPIIHVNKENITYLNIEKIKTSNNHKTISKIFQNINIKTNKDEYKIKLPLLGKHQILNCATVITAMEELQNIGIKINKENILNGLKNVSWLGRMEIMKNNPWVVIDAAHNKDGIKNLTESISMYFNYKNLILILGILSDKEVEEMVKIISNKSYKIITVTPNSTRAELGKKLKEIILKYNKNCEFIEDYEKAYKKALTYANEDDLILISGSIYMIGDMRKFISSTK